MHLCIPAQFYINQPFLNKNLRIAYSWLMIAIPSLHSCKIVDLTHPLSAQAPTWNGTCGFCAEVKKDYDQMFRVQQIKMHAGVGTHMDAPSHRFPGTSSIAEIPLERLIIPACVEAYLILLLFSHFLLHRLLISRHSFPSKPLSPSQKRLSGFLIGPYTLLRAKDLTEFRRQDTSPMDQSLSHYYCS